MDDDSSMTIGGRSGLLCGVCPLQGWDKKGPHMAGLLLFRVMVAFVDITWRGVGFAPRTPSAFTSVACLWGGGQHLLGFARRP